MIVKYLEQHPMIVIVLGIMGISLSAIFVRYSEAPHSQEHFISGNREKRVQGGDS